MEEPEPSLINRRKYFVEKFQVLSEPPDEEEEDTLYCGTPGLSGNLVMLKSGLIAAVDEERDANTIQVSDPTTGDDGPWDIVRTFNGHTDSVKVLLEVEDGILISGSRDRSMRVWSLEDGKCLNIIQTPSSVDFMAKLPNGSIMYMTECNNCQCFVAETWMSRLGFSL